MKKFLLLFSVMLVLVVLAACSEETKSEDKKNDGDATTLRLVYKDEVESNPVSKEYFNKVEEALKKDEGIDVNIELVDMPQGNYAEKLNLLLYSGDIPDLIYFQGGDTQIAQQGLLEDLTPYLEDSKHLKDILEPYNKKRLENYPYLIWVKPLSPKSPVVRSDWFDELETSEDLMANPSVENYYNFFKEAVSASPGEGGKPNYAITTAGNIEELDYIFDMAFGNNQDWLKQSDGTYIYNRVSENEKEKLTFYKRLYEEKLLDPNYLTKKWDTKEKAFYDGEVAVIAGTAGKVIDIYNGKMVQVNGEDSHVKVLPPAKGENQGYGATDITKESRGFAISSQSEHKDLAFKVLDYMASQEGQMLDRLGFEGEHYDVENGEIKLSEKYYGEWYARFWEPSDFETDQPLKTPLLSEPASKSQELAQKFYAENNNFIIPEEYVAKWDAMQNVYKEFATDVITGKRSIDEFDQFVDEWYQAGGKEITQLANEEL